MIHAVVLAAGESRRMGQPKMLLPWRESTVLGSVVTTLLEGPFASVIVVLGHGAGENLEAIRPLTGDPRLRWTVNPDYRKGMLTSVQCGIRAIPPGASGPVERVADYDAILIALGDQPLVTSDTVARVLAGHRDGLTVPAYRGRRGHPVCIDGRLIPPLLSLPPDAGLRDLFRRYPDETTLVDLPGEEILVDLDTPEEYQRLRKEAVRR